jgi:hypothetical protein
MSAPGASTSRFFLSSFHLELFSGTPLFFREFVVSPHCSLIMAPLARCAAVAACALTAHTSGMHRSPSAHRRERFIWAVSNRNAGVRHEAQTSPIPMHISCPPSLLRSLATGVSRSWSAPLYCIATLVSSTTQTAWSHTRF